MPQALKKQKKAEKSSDPSPPGSETADQQAAFVWTSCCSQLGLKPDPPLVKASHMLTIKPSSEKGSESEAFIRYLKSAAPNLQSLNDKGPRTPGQPFVLILR